MKFTYSPKKDIYEVANTKITAVRIRKQKKDEVTLSEKGIKTITIASEEVLSSLGRRKLILLARKVVTTMKAQAVSRAVLNLSDIFGERTDMKKEEIAEIFATNFEMANYEYNQMKTKPKEGWDSVEEIIIVGDVPGTIKEALRKGKIIGEEVNKTRTLSNTPGGMMTPAILARKATEALKGLNVKIKVLNQKDMAKLKMGALLGVAQGSAETPRFIVMEYMGGGTSEKPIVLVGKGVTFDSGGLNLKASTSIHGMHMDMSGGAAVIQTLALSARLKVKRNIIGLVPAVENVPSGTSYRPGDVLRSMSGKTIEVLNTDAEGRIILADALHYAKRYNPALVVDVATLTGAAMVAFGAECSAIFTKDEKLAEKSAVWGEESGDYVWRLPLWDEYKAYIKGTHGDIANINSGAYSGAGGGAITAAIFLQEFTEGYPWMHIDIAPRMIANSQDNLAQGAAGAPVRFLLKLVEGYKK